MLQMDPLSFLDEEFAESEPTNRDVGAPMESDPLSFLDFSEQASQAPQPSNRFGGSKGASDPLSFLDVPQEQGHWYDKLIPKPFKKGEKLLDIYRVEEKTPEELKNMTLEERREYAEDLNRMREMQQSQGFTKGALSGLSFGVSEHIPSLKPDEEDLLVGLGDVVGSYLPITGLYKFLGAPLVHFASKSPVARGGLEALARMTGFGLTGVAHKEAKGIVKGEMPTVEELAKEGATWAAIDAALQAMGLGVAFTQSVNRIAETEGITAREVLGKLWDSTKNFVKSKFGRSIKGEVLPEDAELLLEQAKKTEAAIKPEETEIEVRPTEEKAVQPKEQPSVSSHEKIESDLVQAKNELAELEKTQGKDATNEKSAIIQKINELELDKHNRVKQEKPEEVIKEPSKAVQHAELKDVPQEIYRGSGREKKESVYGHVAEPILGEGKYYAFNEAEAKEFGPNIERKKIDLKNPLVIKNDAEWRKFTKAAGLDFPNPVSMQPTDTLANVRKLRSALEKQGHDGAVVWFPETISDVNANGDSIKTIRNVFGNPQVFEMPHKGQAETKVKLAEEVTEKPEPMAKAPDTRDIIRDIRALEQQQKAIKGNKREDIARRNEIKKEIENKVDELKKLKKPFVDIPQKQIDVSPKKLKSQKDYFVEALEDAINNPTDKEFVAVNVPDDGVFRIPNVKESLEEALKRVKKDWPVKQVNAKSPEYGVKKPARATEQNFEPVLKSKIAEAEPEAVEELPKKQRQVPPRQTRPLQPVKGKKQAVARSKIIDLFRKAFTDPIRLGKIAQKNAAGIHKLWPKVTRLLKANDIETVAHEIGHNLHTTLYGGNAKTPQEQYKNIEAALRPYLNELKPLAHYEPWGMEGFAEFTRLYVTNPDVALDLAPKFYAKFEADLDAQYPEMKNALLEAREYYDSYLQGTPQSRIRAQTNYGSDKGKLANIIDSFKNYLNPDYLKTQFLDDVYPAKRLVAEAFGIPISEVENLKDKRNLYRALRVLKGAVGKGDVFVLHETFNTKTLDKINGSLRDILKQLPNEEAYREFNDYLIARRAIEKRAQNIETGINAGDALAVESDLRPKYGQLAQELDKYNDALLNYAKDSGLLSREQYVLIKKNNLMYAPFQRVMEPEKGGIASGGGRVQAGKPIKRMTGSTRDIIAPVESIIKNTYSVILNSEKNLAGQVLADIAKMKNMGGYVEKVPTPIKLKGKIEGEQVAKELAKRFEQEGLDDLIEYDHNGKPVLREDIADAIPEVFLRFGAGQYPAGENIVTVYNEGKPAYYEVSPDLFEMWNKGIAPYEANLLTKILRIPARTLRAGAILNPRFIQKNIVRDTWGSWLFTKYGKSINDPAGLFIDTLYSPLSMLAQAAKKGDLYVEWLKSGGGMSTMQSLDREGITKKLEEVRHGYKPHQVMKWLRQAAEISEEANRLSEFGKALEVEGKTRLGREIAAFAARDLSIDFAKMGLQTKALNQIIPFWNATVQGGDKLLRTMFNPEDRKNFLPRIIGFIVLPSLMLAWLNKDDKNIQEFYEEEKDFNFIVPVNGEYLKIPVPFETGVLAHGLTQRMFNYFMKNDPKAFEKFMGSISDAMLPGFIPTAGLPFFETWANKNFFTGGRIIPRGQEDLIAKYQYKNNTSSTARLLGRAMTYMLGQETRSKAASPATIDHFINSWGGGLGQMMIKISDASLEAAGLSAKIAGPKQAITEKYGLDAFTARFPRASTRSIEKFYDNYADATARQKSFKYAEKMDLETPESQEGAYQSFDKIYDYNTLQQAYKAMQSCQKEINNIWNDPALEPELKKQFIDDLYMQMIEFAKEANEDIRQYRLAQED